MSDEEFMKLKNAIKEIGLECHEVNHTFSCLLQEMSDLDEQISKLTFDIYKVKSEVSKYEFKN